MGIVSTGSPEEHAILLTLSDNPHESHSSKKQQTCDWSYHAKQRPVRSHFPALPLCASASPRFPVHTANPRRGVLIPSPANG